MYADENDLFRSTWELSSDGMIAVNSKGKICFCNMALCEILGYAPEELIDHELDMLIPDLNRPKHHEQVEDFIRTKHARVMAKGRTVTGLHKNGHLVPLEIGLSVAQYKGETHAVAIVRDITERREMEKKLQYYAYYDQLTGLANRTFFYKKLQDSFERAKRYGESFAILYLDLDKFKAVNDIHGHQSGDEVLVEAANRITKLLRTTDTASRVGGDEFVILLTATADTTNCERIATRIIEELTKPIKTHAETVTIGVSVGIAFFERGMTDPDEVIKNADKAMYVAKSLGNGHYMLYEPSFSKVG